MNSIFNSQIQKVVTFVVATFVAILSFLIIPYSFKVHAQEKTFTYDSYNVAIKLNADSTMDVTETITYRFNGLFHGVFREITLDDRQTLDKCKSNPTLQCGGFEFLGIQDVLDGNGKSLRGKYKELNVNDGYKSKRRVEWEFSSSGKEFNDEMFTWTIKYKVYGSIGYFDDYDLFYWNVLPEERNEMVEKSKVTILFPADINFSESTLKIFGDSAFTSNYDKLNRKLTIDTTKLSSYGYFTVIQKIPKGTIKQYANLKLILDPTEQNVVIDGIILEKIGDNLRGLPAGNIKLTFSKSGYYSKDINLNLKPGETKELKVTLEPTFLTRIIKIVIITANVLGCIFMPLFIYFIIAWWSRKGRDRGGNKTIVPWFEPPDKIPPYLLGSIKDEKVDLLDITSSIIDLAYRGFIKIKEVGEKKVTDYQLIKQKDFNSSELTEAEKGLLNSIFSLSLATSEDNLTVNLSDLKYKFYDNMPDIKNKVYDEMLTKGYFDRRPDKVRANYLGFGIVATIISCVSFFILPVIGIVTVPFALIIFGVGMTIMSFFMPSKTPKGTEVFEQAKGFKMYLHTAERFRMQKLTPQTFEKYLSYAMVFKIEKEWAGKFKDIYKKAPSWYEGRSLSSFDSLYLANALSSFNVSAASSMMSVPASTGSGGFGGGFSSGGGFSGGFSGGGGGGGGSGAW